MASAAARFTVLVVLPTPPFWLAMLKTRCDGGRGQDATADGGATVAGASVEAVSRETSSASPGTSAASRQTAASSTRIAGATATWSPSRGGPPLSDGAGEAGRAGAPAA